LEALAKDIINSQALNESGGNEGFTWGDIARIAEGLIHSKYSDSTSQNYKGLSKKVE
jgi:hypothetical protein